MICQGRHSGPTSRDGRSGCRSRACCGSPATPTTCRSTCSCRRRRCRGDPPSACERRGPTSCRTCACSEQGMGCPIFVAVNLMKVGLLLQKELMEEKIFSYIVAWRWSYVFYFHTQFRSSSILALLLLRMICEWICFAVAHQESERFIVAGVQTLPNVLSSSLCVQTRVFFGILLIRCQTPSRRRPGCAYLDTCVLYVDGQDEIVREASRSPNNEIYLRIPHPLMDTVQEAAEARLMRFFMTTFWCNIDVFRCQQVALREIKPSVGVELHRILSTDRHLRRTIGQMQFQ